MGICWKKLAGELYNLCPPRLAISQRLDDRDYTINTTACANNGQSGRMPDGMFNKKFQENFNGIKDTGVCLFVAVGLMQDLTLILSTKKHQTKQNKKLYHTYRCLPCHNSGAYARSNIDLVN